MSKKTQDATASWLEGLKNTGAISEEEWKVLEGATAKQEFVDYVGETALSRSDYSRRQNELQAEFQAKTQELNDYQKELANWRGLTEKEVSTIRAEAEQLRAERQRLVGVAQSFGLTEDDLGTPVAPFTTNPNLQVQKQPAQHEIDPTKYMSRDEFQNEAVTYALLPGEIADITAEHVELFGKAPNKMRQIVETAIREKRTVRDVYEDEYKVADRRSELANAEREAEIKRRVEEELTRFRTENPDARIPLPNDGSYALRNVLPKSDPNSANQAFQQNNSVDAAVRAWNSIDHSKE